MRVVTLTTMSALFAVGAPAAAAPSPAIRAAVANPARLDADRTRDKYRHPAETLDFFGVAPGQTVIEYSPGGGWFTRILVPLLAGNGHYEAIVGDNPRSIANAKKLVAGLPGGASARVSGFDPATATMAAPGSADRVLTFRNVHNLLMPEDGGDDQGKVAAAFFQAAYKALKPGGVLGIEDHRLPESAPTSREQTSGYVKRSTVVRLATAAGFRLSGESAVNANSKDTHDWPKGVWTLPPTLHLVDQDLAQ